MKTKKLGTPKTIKELKEMIKGISDESSFGFRNQPRQSLYISTDKNETVIFFQ